MLGQNYATIAIADLYIFLTDNIRWRVENNANMRSEFSRKSISFDSQPKLNWHIIHQIPLTIHKAFPFIEQAMSIKSKIVTIIGHSRPPTDANKTEITQEVALPGGGLHGMQRFSAEGYILVKPPPLIRSFRPKFLHKRFCILSTIFSMAIN